VATAATWPDLTASQLSTLCAALQLLESPGPGVHVEWLPKFGCALLPLAPASRAALQPGHVALYLVAPDGWSFGMHRCARVCARARVCVCVCVRVCVRA
jgi:hypothetical protein